jgi:hypothetical protein
MSCEYKTSGGPAGRERTQRYRRSTRAFGPLERRPRRGRGAGDRGLAPNGRPDRDSQLRWQLVTSGLKSTVADVAEDYLQLELERLDALQVAVWDAAMAGDIASANVLLRIIAQRAGLLRLERSKPEAGPPRMVVDVEAHRAYIRTQECNQGH